MVVRQPLLPVGLNFVTSLVNFFAGQSVCSTKSQSVLDVTVAR